MSAPGKSTIALVTGRKESGKTWLVKRGLARARRFVVWDVRGEYADPERGVAGARLWTDLRAWRDHLLAGGTIEREVFACPSSQFDAWCRWVFATGNLLVVVEELSRYTTTGRATEALLDFFDRSRHAGIDLIATTARVGAVPKSLRTQVDELLVAKTTEPEDLAYLTSWLGGPAVAQRVRDLQPLSFLRYRL